MLQKLKSLVLDDTVYGAFLLVLVAVCSFGLGRMSVPVAQNQPAAAIQAVDNLKISPQILASSSPSASTLTEAIATTKSETATVLNYVASKSGTKYHALHCPGAKQIKDTNKIFFATPDEAEAAGYTRASNCKF